MENFELVVIPAPGISQFVAEMELARRLVAHDPRISVTILVADIPVSEHKLDAYFKSLDAGPSSLSPRISIVELPPLPDLPKDAAGGAFFPVFNAHMEAYKPIVKGIVQERSNDGRRIAGFLMDMFCSTMADVASELGLPSYFFFASGAGMLSFMFHFEGPLGGEVPDAPSLEVPGFSSPLPSTAWPSVIKNKNSAALFLRNTKQFVKSKGVMANTFLELEPDLIRSLQENNRVPPIYPIGPIVHVDGRDPSRAENSLLKWLDAQPPRSVVFLCFGTNGAFGEEQIREIAAGLERSGHRFVWSLRRQQETGKGPDYDDFNEVLPEGFLERVAGVGKVVGWAPQKEVLGHVATGAFVSHCGWNSLLESLWLGVPVAAWPLYAEQQLNAYQWVKEAGLATEMRIDYAYTAATLQANVLVGAEEVERGIRRIMDGEEGAAVRKTLAEMSQTAKKALLHGGSSHRSLSRFIDDVIHNVSST